MLWGGGARCLSKAVRGCGKTWMARRFARSEVRLDDEAALVLAASDPAEVLRGPIPRLLDEWQNAPQLWNRVRRECDDRPEPGQFILTGSAAPQDDVTRHTGTGRISRVLLRPMSLWEMGNSTGVASLEKMFEGETVSLLPSKQPGAARHRLSCLRRRLAPEPRPQRGRRHVVGR